MRPTTEERLWREIAALKRQLDVLTTREAPAAWIADNRIFSYASATTVTTPGDITAQYGVGTKLRWKQTGDSNYRFAYLTAASYGAPNTTLTLRGGSDYSVANAAITEWWFSYAALAPGFPAWHNYAVTWACLAGGNPLSIAAGLCSGLSEMRNMLISRRVNREISEPGMILSMQDLSRMAIPDRTTLKTIR